jgi:hypothetical protein
MNRAHVTKAHVAALLAGLFAVGCVAEEEEIGSQTDDATESDCPNLYNHSYARTQADDNDSIQQPSRLHDMGDDLPGYMSVQSYLGDGDVDWYEIYAIDTFRRELTPHITLELDEAADQAELCVFTLLPEDQVDCEVGTAVSEYGLYGCCAAAEPGQLALRVDMDSLVEDDSSSVFVRVSRAAGSTLSSCASYMMYYQGFIGL